jgi:predicted CXXCH cytochrome family protein
VRALIRFLTRIPGGGVETRERVFEGEALTLGRATDQVLHLKDVRVALEHARITVSGGRIVLACRAPAQVIVNGTVCRDAQLQPGDTVQVGANILRLEAPAAGYDLQFAFELDASADAQQAIAELPKLALADLRLRKRGLAWAAFVTLLALGLAIPWFGASRENGTAALRAAHLPTDRAWLTGPLHSAHANLNHDCATCHERPFQRVRSESCLTCHANHLQQHVPSNHPRSAELLSERCTSCHVEHDEPSRLVQTDQRLCAECHEAKQAHAPSASPVPRAADFLAAHPEFRVTMLAARLQATQTPTANETMNWETVRLALDAKPAPRERSHLKFPHDVHLAAKGIQSPTGDKVLSCADCHEPEPGGARMQPIRMEQHCASCHTLTFDPAEPSRAVPHGEPAAVLASLTEYYGARYLAGYPDARGSARPDRPIGLPRQVLSPAERERLLGLARDRAASVARDLFERRVCVDCHAVERQEHLAVDALTEGDVTWRVQPVKLTERWMPKARFDHARHSTELTPCKTCHAADRSTSATDVLMPSIEDCRTCHGGEQGEASRQALVPSTCTLCHAFHGESTGLWTTTRSSHSPLAARPR